jgi:predicted AAA+ superfamily ATPase
LQSEVDSEPAAGRFILTGSQHFGLSQAISQSLAGRCGRLTLLAPDLEELSAFPAAPTDLYTMLWQGSYPRIYDREIPAHQWLADYISTYVERDVRQVVNVGDLLAFSGFLKLCAGRTGQEINLSSMGNDAGISHNTARAWLSVLETSYIIHRLPAWHGNIRKQVVKAPKLHFLDSGVACHLLGIRELEQLRHHPLRGALFESWVVAELHKAQLNRGEEPNMFHYRESRGPEIDLLISKGKVLHAIEIKSGATASADFFRNFQHLAERLSETGLPDQIKNHVIYGGEQSQKRTQARLWSWRDTLKVL